MKNWVNWQAPLYDFFIGKRKQLDIPLHSVVDVIAENEGMVHVNYKEYAGWIDPNYLEPFWHALPFDCVDLSDIQTVDDSDAKQYVVLDGMKQVNMCGEICVAYILGMKLSDVIANWKIKDVPFYRRIFGGGKAHGTSSADLGALFSQNNKDAHLLELEMKKYSPARLFELCSISRVIISCTIDGSTGVLRGSGVGHWCVVVDVKQDRQGFGWIDLFNPFNNCVERYSWREFLASTKNYPYGVVV